MGRILFLLIALVAVVLAVLVAAPGIIPVEAYKGRLESAATTALGREVRFSDDLTLKIIPRTAFTVRDLTIANAAGFDGDYLAAVNKADIGVGLIPLLSGSVEVDRFVLTEPTINLARKANGEINWNLAASAEPAPEGGAERAPRDIKLGDVRIVDGAATYADGAANRTYQAEDINLVVVLNSLAEPMQARGDMTLEGQKANIDLVLTNLSDILESRPANLKLDMTIGRASAGADLTVETGEAIRYRGAARLNAPDLPEFARLVGAELADAPGFDRLNATGTLDGDASSLRLSNAVVKFDDIDATGVLNLNWAGARPKATGALSSDKLDLRPYMPAPVEANGFPAWSTAAMDFTSLRNIDADLDLSVGAIFMNDLEFGESRLKVTIDNGRMTADIPELAMYGGQGSGRLVVNARSAVPSFAGNFDVGAVEAQPLSLDLLKHDNLLGLGALKLDFTATGASQDAIMRSVNGSGSFDLADGALKGINIAKIARAASSLTTGVNPAALANAVATARGPNETTDFSEFLSQFTMQNGVITSPTIALTGPFVTMNGAGTVNLAAQTIDLRLQPKATTTADGAGGRQLAIPMRIGGTFSQPTVTIDAEALLKGGATDFLRDVLGGRTNSSTATEDEAADPAKSVLDSILGGDKKEDAAEGEEPSEADLAREAIGAIFGRKKDTGDEKKDDDSDQ